MKTIYKCEFKFTNLNTRVWLSTFFYLEGDDKFAIERIAIVKAMNELKAPLTDYQLSYYKIEETQASKDAKNKF